MCVQVNLIKPNTKYIIFAVWDMRSNCTVCNIWGQTEPLFLVCKVDAETTWEAVQKGIRDCNR